MRVDADRRVAAEGGGERPKRGWLLALVVIGLVAIAGGATIALAGHEPTAADRYTGCLKTNGALAKVAAGSEPARPCAAAESLVHLAPGGPANQFFVPGDDAPAANGARLLDAMATAGGAALPDAPVAVLVGPGLFEVGPGGLAMLPNVTISGSGQTGTTILCSCPVAVYGADGAEMSHLRVENTSDELAEGVGILADGTSPILRHVTVAVSGAADRPGIWNMNGADTEVSHVTVTAHRPGGAEVNVWAIKNEGVGTSPALTDVVAHARATEPATPGVTAIYSEAGATPIMRRVTATATGPAGGAAAAAIGNFLAAPDMVGIEAYATAPSGQVAGVSNNFDHEGAALLGLTPVPFSMIDVIAHAEGTGPGAAATGVEFFDASGTMDRVAATAVAPDGPAFGVRLFGGLGDAIDPTLDVTASRLAGGTASIRDEASAVVRIGTSQLSGPVEAGSTTCVFSYDGAFAPLGGDCLTPP